MNGAESLVRTLVGGGVNVCFANPGTSEMHFVAALDRVEGMRCVLGLFEGVVTGAADGYARMTGNPAATLLHLGPGMANGLANIHNANKALTPMVNIVGDHATYHRRYDAPLTTDIETAAKPFSRWVKTSPDAKSVAADGAAAIAATRTPPGQIATLILPADTAWNEGSGPANVPPAAQPAPVSPEAVAEAARVLRSGEPCLLLVTGRALRQEGLDLAGRIAAKTGARLIAQGSNARTERGRGRRAGVRSQKPSRATKKEHLAGKVEVFLTRHADRGIWEALVHPGRKMPLGERVLFGEGELEGEIIARQPGVLAGLDAALLAFELVDPGLRVERICEDGARISRGEVVARISGSAWGMLGAERTALNFLCRMSGIATATRRLADAIEGTKAKIICTRKTTPGLRALEKAAVRLGGGANHRFGLDDAMLIKDNHITIAGGVKPALERARRHAGHLVKIELEVDTLDQLAEALAVGVDAVLLDNMTPQTMRRAVEMVDGRAVTEASGRITVETAPEIASTGVDLISSGWITHSAPILDLGLDIAG